MIPLRNLPNLKIHPTLQIDKILPSLTGIPGILIPLPHNLVQMAGGNFRPQRFLLTARGEDGFDPRASAQLLADMVHDVHDGILVPPDWIVDAFDFPPHDDDSARGDEFPASGVGGAEMGRDARGDHVSV